jgi:hypothetical protein
VDDLEGLYSVRPGAALALSICLLSLLGISRHFRLHWKVVSHRAAVSEGSTSCLWYWCSAAWCRRILSTGDNGDDDEAHPVARGAPPSQLFLAAPRRRGDRSGHDSSSSGVAHGPLATVLKSAETWAGHAPVTTGQKPNAMNVPKSIIRSTRPWDRRS